MASLMSALSRFQPLGEANSWTQSNVCFGSKAVTQRPENFQMAGFRAENASSNVCLRPKADTRSAENPATMNGDYIYFPNPVST